jgi:hypothetical protein
MGWLSVRVFGSDHTAGFSEPEARFFIACALLGVEAMHKQGVIHRCVCDVYPMQALWAYPVYSTQCTVAPAGDLKRRRQHSIQS